jgi:hypothetical protein
MANTLTPRVRLCALVVLCAGCGSEAAPHASSAAGAAGSNANSASAGAAPTATAGGTSTAGASNASGGATSGSIDVSAGSGGKSNGGQSGTFTPPAVNGRSVYALECHGDSKDCNLGAVPCFGVGSQTPNVAAGWACANRCTSNADCSDAPSGAEAHARCVSFTSANHCVLVCKNENQSFACPGGMNCYTPPKSPIGYCLWQ